MTKAWNTSGNSVTWHQLAALCRTLTTDFCSFQNIKLMSVGWKIGREECNWGWKGNSNDYVYKLDRLNNRANLQLFFRDLYL